MADPAGGGPGPAALPADLVALIARARAGDAAALAGLRAALDADPGLWRRLGDLAAHARSARVEMIAGGDPLVREALARKAAALLDELAGTAPTPLGRLLAERVAAAWLRLMHADLLAAEVGTGHPAGERAARDRLDRADRRFLAAVGGLATLRRLLPPNQREDDSPRSGGRPALGLFAPGPTSVLRTDTEEGPGVGSPPVPMGRRGTTR